MGKFTDEDIRLAQKVQATYGIPASVTLAQYALESAYGTSSLARNNNNYFGMKAGSNGWQSFASKEASFMAYGKLMSSDLYTSKTNGATTIDEYVYRFAETYAPSSDGNYNYAGKVMAIINQNDLTQYDSGELGKMSFFGLSDSNGIKWWGDIVVTVFALLLVVMGVVFIGLAVVSNTTGEKVVNSVKKVVSKDE